MRYNHLLLMICAFLLVCCRKEHRPPPIEPSPSHILLKDITSPHLPAPYYHFEYNSDSTVSKASFASDYFMYDVLYSGSKIAEMRNNILVNQDTLRYTYDNTGKVTMIKIINNSNIVYRVVFFKYDGNLIKQIEWDQREGNIGFLIVRTLSFTFFADGNVKSITEHRPPTDGVADYISVKTFDQYDDKINVDDFSLIHDGIHDHLFLLQGFRLQKNNPKKEKLSVNGIDLYSEDYTYTYNSDNTPSNKAGDFIYLSGQYTGQRFQTNSFYTYY